MYIRVEINAYVYLHTHLEVHEYMYVELNIYAHMYVSFPEDDSIQENTKLVH